MVDVTVTEAEVLPGSDTTYFDGTFGETITAGEVVYLDTSDDKLKLADCDASSATATIKGIAMNSGGDGQPGKVAIAGSIDPGFTVTVGETYVLSGTAGGIAPIADLAAGDWVSHLGVGLSASSLQLRIYNSGVQVPA